MLQCTYSEIAEAGNAVHLGSKGPIQTRSLEELINVIGARPCAIRHLLEKEN